MKWKMYDEKGTDLRLEVEASTSVQAVNKARELDHRAFVAREADIVGTIHNRISAEPCPRKLDLPLKVGGDYRVAWLCEGETRPLTRWLIMADAVKAATEYLDLDFTRDEIVIESRSGTRHAIVAFEA